MQWAEELARWETEYDKHGKPVTLMGKFLNNYLPNRRNKPQQLQRISLLEDDADALGLADACEQSVTLSHDRPLSSVTKFIKLEEADPKQRSEAQARAEWLRALDSSSLVAVKSELGDTAASTPTVSSAATTPATVQEVAAAAAQAAVAALTSGAAQTSGEASTMTPPAPSNATRQRPRPRIPSNLVPPTAPPACAAQTSGEASTMKPPAPSYATRQRPRIPSNLVPPTAPPANESKQLSTAKAVPSKQKQVAEKERSSTAAADQRGEGSASAVAGDAVAGDSSDEDGAHDDPAAPKQPMKRKSAAKSSEGAGGALHQTHAQLGIRARNSAHVRARV